MSTPALVNNYTNPNIAGMCFEKVIEAYDKMDRFIFAFSHDIEKTSPDAARILKLNMIQNSYFNRVSTCKHNFFDLCVTYEEIVENPNTSRFDMDLLFIRFLSVNETFMDLCKEYLDIAFSKFGVELISENREFELIQTKSSNLIHSLKDLLSQMPELLSKI